MCNYLVVVEEFQCDCFGCNEKKMYILWMQIGIANVEQNI